MADNDQSSVVKRNERSPKTGPAALENQHGMATHNPSSRGRLLIAS